MRKRLIAFLLIVTACSSTGVVPMDQDTYMIAKRKPTVGFGTADGAKADIYREANDFCEKKGMKVETVKLEMQDSGFGRPANASLQFRCVANVPNK
jgi:hypothetical protein